jgi:hypothetical protein
MPLGEEGTQEAQEAQEERAFSCASCASCVPSRTSRGRWRDNGGDGENEKGGFMFPAKKPLALFSIAFLLLFVSGVSGVAQTVGSPGAATPGQSSSGQNPSATPNTNSRQVPNPNPAPPKVSPNSTLPNQNPNMVPDVNPNPHVTRPNEYPMPRPNVTSPNVINPNGTTGTNTTTPRVR